MLVHCHASLSRSVVFILAHLMRTRKISLLDAGKMMKPVWDATWCAVVSQRPTPCMLPPGRLTVPEPSSLQHYLGRHVRIWRVHVHPSRTLSS